MDRTLKIKGIGFSTTADNVEITVKIDGNVIFSGPVLTDKTTVYNPNIQPGTPVTTMDATTTVAEWTENIDFAGTRALEITATKGVFLCTQTTSTYMPVATKTAPTTIFSSGENDVPCYVLETADGFIRNVYSNVTINGVAHTDLPSPGGFSAWGIQPNNSLVATLNISAGIASPIRCDDSNILDTTTSTGDGVTVDFVGPPYNTDVINKLKVYVDSVLMAYNQFNATYENGVRTIHFNTAPAMGSAVKIDIVQKWDATWTTYHGFFYYEL
jgi:hypothetical protein